MEQKINVETLASSLVDGYMDAEDLRKEIISIKRDHVWSWMAVSDENMCTEKLKMRNQIYLLDLIIEGLTDKEQQEQD
jgi:hypothetical protein